MGINPLYTTSTIHRSLLPRTLLIDPLFHEGGMVILRTVSTEKGVCGFLGRTRQWILAQL